MTSEQQQWQAVVERDGAARFLYGVRSTGVYCRPGCPSRRPARRHVLFFDTVAAAERAGFRACRRCHPNQHGGDPRTEAIRLACAAIERHESVPTLTELAAGTGLSPFYLQRLFKRIVGVTPREYAARLRLGRFRAQVRNGAAVTGAMYDAGYGSSSRLYESAATKMGMTPGTYKRGGEGETINYAVAESLLGCLLVARTTRGICAVNLGDSEVALESWLRREFHAARIERDQASLGPAVRALLEHLDGRTPRIDLPVDIRATAFQEKVWRELQRIPWGSTRSYGEIARAIGRPAAARAVARACAANPVPLIVPCHRVVPASGGAGGYRLGTRRKRALLDAEKRIGSKMRA
jgi:AraC family transcriptional regulator of adaptative response/methylated-DNA-[protein]-cysteine methyltransferase